MKKKNLGLMMTAVIIVGFGAYSVFFSSKNSRVYHPHFSDRNGLNIIEKGNGYSLIIISVDTLRPDYMEVNGYDLVTSPTMDRLIKESIHFVRAITPIPRTTQALASMLTGCYPYKTDVRSLWDRMSVRTISLAEILKKCGYQTVAVVSNHILLPDRGLGRGFDIYDYGTDARDAVKTARNAVKHLRRMDSEQPFFLWVHFIDPHVPYYPSKKIAQTVDPDYMGKYRYRFGQKKGGVGEKAFPADLGKERASFRNDLSESENQHVRRLYAGDIMEADLGIDILLDAVLNVSQDPLVVFTADHGESLGEHDYYFDHGAYVYNASLRIPLAFRLPSEHPAFDTGQIDQWVSLVDIVPTLLDLMSIKIESQRTEKVDGVSLVKLWSTEENSTPRILFAESGNAFFPNSIKRRVNFEIEGRFRCLIQDRYKLIWTPYQTEDMSYELYDLIEDPNEIHNLFDERPSVAQPMMKKLAEWHLAQRSYIRRKSRFSSKDEEILRSLGYIK